MSRSEFRRFGVVLVLGLAGSLATETDSWAATSSANEQQIEQALGQISAADFLQTPLEDVAAYLSDLHSLRIQIDRLALDELGIDEREPITVSADGIQLESMLGLILDPHGLTWTVWHDTLVITTHEAARKAVSTRIYAIDDLTKPVADGAHDRDRYGAGMYEEPYGPMIGGSPLNPAEILKVITTTIEPNSWEEDGPGRACTLAIGARTIFVIRQDYRTHRMIDGFLDAIRQMLREDPKAHDEPKTPAKVYSRPPTPPATKAKPSQTPPAADPFGAPPAARAKQPGVRPADDPFGASAPTKPSQDDPFDPAPADDPFGGGAAPVNDPFGAPPVNDPFD